MTEENQLQIDCKLARGARDTEYVVRKLTLATPWYKTKHWEEEESKGREREGQRSSEGRRKKEETTECWNESFLRFCGAIYLGDFLGILRSLFRYFHFLINVG